jgi:hypothetical protein
MTNANKTLYEKLTILDDYKYHQVYQITENRNNMHQFLSEEELTAIKEVQTKRPNAVDRFIESNDKKQFDAMSKYEKNPIFHEALYGRQSITESLEELAQVNKGYRKWLPRRKDKAQNERVEQMGELISKPYGLESKGIFYPDNFVTAAVETAVLVPTVGIFAAYILKQGATNPKSAKEIMQMSMQMSYLMTPLFGIYGGLAMGKSRFASLPFDQAGYIDAKIEWYKSGKV